jgi:hypothetical protein
MVHEAMAATMSKCLFVWYVPDAYAPRLAAVAQGSGAGGISPLQEKLAAQE